MPTPQEDRDIEAQENFARSYAPCRCLPYDVATGLQKASLVARGIARTRAIQNEILEAKKRYPSFFKIDQK